MSDKEPTPLWEVLLQELCCLREVRDEAGKHCSFAVHRDRIIAETLPERVIGHDALYLMDGCLVQQRVQQARLARVYQLTHTQAEHDKPQIFKRFALCLSGGGIRSATLNLGLLQGLARTNWLKRCEYLSTVSGGGFIGSWLMAWIHRVAGGVDAIDTLLEQGPSKVGSSRDQCRAAMAHGKLGLCQEPSEVTHLREYSNYLTPRMGLFSMDTWALIAAYPRNLLINWIVFLPLLLSVIMLCWGVVAIGLKLQETVPVSISHASEPTTVLRYITAFTTLRVTGLILFLVSIAAAIALSPQADDNALGQAPRGASPWRRWLPRVLVSIPICFAVLILTLITSQLAANLRQSNWTAFGPTIVNSFYINCLLAVLAVAGRRMLLRKESASLGMTDGSWWKQLGMLILRINCASLPVITLLLVLIRAYGESLHPILLFGIGPLARILAVFLIFTIVVALNSEGQSPESEGGREWWSCIMGVLVRFAAIFAVTYTCVIALPYVLNLDAPSATAGSCISIGGVFSGAYALYSGSSSRFGAIKDVNPMLHRGMMQTLPGIAAAVFILILLVAASWAYVHWFPAPMDFATLKVNGDWGALLRNAFVWPVALVLGSMMLAFPVNINRFSLHGTYRSRLIRAYLGASRGERRQPDTFTGFDPNDNLPMHFLRRSSKFTECDLQGSVDKLAKMLRTERHPFFVYAHNILCVMDARKADRLKEYVGGQIVLETEVKKDLLDLLNQLLLDPALYDKTYEKTKTTDQAILVANAQVRNNGSVMLRNRLILEEQFRTTDGESLLDSAIVRPLHVVNATLNLVGGERLAWQQRKAKSFVFTPLHSGFDAGFRPTVEYAQSISLGGAMTISGAAASPNMGYHSSSLVTFLMTLFNIRLGCWLGNPAYTCHYFGKSKDTYGLGGPRFSFRCFLDEALGRTNEKNPYVYLSDGGHFDNTGLYEMVRRRHHFILLSDASADRARKFSDLGSAIQKIRVDLGVPITLVHESTYLGDTGARVATFRIEYSAVDSMSGVKDGILIYAKPALNGEEPTDVYTYQKESGEFPHETTADQWFSEAQFESYRQLGELLAYEIVREANANDSAEDAPAEKGSVEFVAALLPVMMDVQASKPLDAEVPAAEKHHNKKQHNKKHHN